MQAMDERAMLKALEGIPQGTMLFVSYLAGRPATDKQEREARRHTENPARARRCFVGAFIGTRSNVKDEAFMTVFAHNRDKEGPGGTLREGNYRSFNPSLGTLLGIEVL